LCGNPIALSMRNFFLAIPCWEEYIHQAMLGRMTWYNNVKDFQKPEEILNFFVNIPMNSLWSKRRVEESEVLDIGSTGSQQPPHHQLLHEPLSFASGSRNTDQSTLHVFFFSLSLANWTWKIWDITGLLLTFSIKFSILVRLDLGIFWKKT
jgi:hypothetical protein